ncbi:tRNA (adenine(22)-N(1))-methyltransferase TrmK [Pseudoalteromonas sp.]|uniref:tRNA (adenine(22)-N(1))-methyltransferase TrmK n=1 Tax=Pseudoalteromonas sp. TaxID=53249 RepID=UPI0035669316
MKLSKRLSAINNLITQPYDVIWDTCCDHGYLGMALLQRQAAKQVNFVDIVPALIDNLASRLAHLPHATTTSAWQVICQHVGDIKLTASTRQLIVIAGVGGDLMLSLVQQIVANNLPHKEQPLEFILCPVHHAYKLRSGLSQLGLGLLSEQIVTENQRFYEVLHVSFAADTAIHVCGSVMWDFSQTSHQQYVQRLLAHYTRMRQQDQPYLQKVITDYQQLIKHSLQHKNQLTVY